LRPRDQSYETRDQYFMIPRPKSWSRDLNIPASSCQKRTVGGNFLVC